MNPIEQRMASGMSAIAAFLTEATCGEACWEAREDICRCSCGGRNHGCLRDKNGVRPVRNAKIDGYRYELLAVGPTGLYEQAEVINKAAGPKSTYGHYTYNWRETDSGAPARLKRATKEQLAKWPELKAYRETIDAIRAKESYAWIEVERKWPSLLWKRIS